MIQCPLECPSSGQDVVNLLSYIMTFCVQTPQNIQLVPFFLFFHPCPQKSTTETTNHTV